MTRGCSVFEPEPTARRSVLIEDAWMALYN